MRDGRDVLNHRDLQADSLQGADRSFTTLAGALNKDLDRLETMLHRSGSSRFSGALSGERSGLLAAAEAEAPEEAQERALPCVSVTVTMVLLKEERI